MNCPACHKYFDKKQKAIDHIIKYHSAELDRLGMDASQYLYYSTHGTTKGACMVCGGPTEWNYQTGKPYKVCTNPKCRENLSKKADQNMMKIYGKTTLLTDMKHQKKMQEHRPTHSYYTFSDGGKVPYLSQLEKNFLWFCDSIMDMTSNMIQESPETFEYYDAKDDRTRQYIPDYYLPDYNLLVEIKDGGDHPNTNPAFIEETKYKVKLKDDVMKKQTKYNFIRISGKNYGPFVELLYQIVHVGSPAGFKKNQKHLVVITESACADIDDQMNFNSPEILQSLYIGILVENDSTHVRGVLVSPTHNFVRSYVCDYVNMTSCELPENAQIDPADELYVYEYIGNQNNSTFTNAVIQCCLNHETFDVMELMRDHELYFSSSLISNNKEKRMDFIYRKCYEGAIDHGA